MYEQLKLDDKYRTYLEGAMLYERVLWTGIKPTPYQKPFELIVGTTSGVINFHSANKQFNLIAISLVYYRSDQHRSVYDSYNTELASTKIKKVQLENASNTYSSYNTVKFDTSNAHDKYLLYMQFVAWYYKGWSIVPLSDYVNNPTFQELPTLNEYFKSADQQIFIDLRRGKGYTGELERINRDDNDLTVTVTLKSALTKKLRLRVTRYYQGEYLFSLSNEGLIMNYKEYGVNKPKSFITVA